MKHNALSGSALLTFTVTPATEVDARFLHDALPILFGAVEVKEMLWLAGGAATTVTLWVTRGAALKLALPAWSAGETTAELQSRPHIVCRPLEETEMDAPAMEKLTVRLEVAGAVGVE